MALGGLIAFAVLAGIGFASRQHRGFTHSLLYALIMSCCVYAMCPPMAPYFLVGCVLHLLLDILNHPFQGRGVWLLYPIKTGSWFVLKLCKAGGKANKAFYFIGIGILAAVTCYWLFANRADVGVILVPVVVFAYVAVSLHFVRVKSERELRHVAHIRGEL